jgi:hypothetical protein
MSRSRRFVLVCLALAVVLLGAGLERGAYALSSCCSNCTSAWSHCADNCYLSGGSPDCYGTCDSNFYGCASFCLRLGSYCPPP